MSESRRMPNNQRDAIREMWLGMYDPDTGMRAALTNIRQDFKRFIKATREWQMSVDTRLIHLEDTQFSKEEHQTFIEKHNHDFELWEAQHERKEETFRESLEKKHEKRQVTVRDWLIMILTAILTLATVGAWLK